MLSFLHQPKSFYKRLFLLMLPVAAQNIITTSLGFLDTFMVGLLGSDEMSAVTVANVPIFVIQLVIFGLQSGSSVLISQYWGKGDRESINRVIGIGFYIAGGVSLLFAVVMALCPAFVLSIVTNNADLVALGIPYIRIVGFSYVLNSLSSIYIAMQRCIENPKFGMLVFGASVLCNTLGNYVLIFGKLGFPSLGIRGAALATLLSRILEFTLTFSFALRCRTVPLQMHAVLAPGGLMLTRFLHYSAPVLLNETLWGVGFSLYTVVMGHMKGSSDLIAAYTIAGNIDKILTAAIFGVAAASAVIVGKEIGAGNIDGVSDIGKTLCFTAFVTGAVVGALEYLLFRTTLVPYVLPVFRLSETAASVCAMMILCYACGMPFHAINTTLIIGVLRGGGDVRTALLIDVLPLWCVAIPLSALLGIVLKVPDSVFCLCLIAEYVVKAPIGLFRLYSGKWIHDVTKAV